MTAPILCRIGLHDYVEDDAFFTKGVKICNRCAHPENAEQFQRLLFERQLWAEAERRRYSFGKSYDYVFKAYFNMG